ncbi:hypothetical protein BDF21DRAFT_490397 [Thamnidium elegans]|nr:hypothetical protein BDF21DRAFT_490397 [Thamnidium elegans]
MYFDSTTQKQVRPFVYIQYPNNNNNNEQLNIRQRIPSSGSSSSSTSSVLSTQPQPTDQTEKEVEKPKKKKRQHIGYACDKCRERRVGCDRGKPICGQCKDRYQCQYSNHTLRLDNVSMRQRLDELEGQVGWLTSFAASLERDYRTSIPRINTHVQVSSSSAVTQPQPQPEPELKLQEQLYDQSIVDWAIGKGWPIIENNDGWKTIFTSIKSFEGLSEFKETLQSTMDAMYKEKGMPLYRQPTTQITPNLITVIKPAIPTLAITDNKQEHTFTLFESLNRYASSRNNHFNTNNDDRYLETDVMTRLIHQHHKCGFPILVSPSRFENHYKQGQLKSLVLSSVFSHSVPHCCIYHPQLTQIQDFRELGNKFYDHSHDLLGIDEPANLSNIHQRTLLITYDLDLGRVRRAFLHIGIAIRMCFMLNLHRPEGYINCKTPFEREQSKRIFWTVWFYDNMVSHLFHDQLATIKLDQILIELPTPLPEFNRVEMDQTMFAISLIQVRKLSAAISEGSRKMEPRGLVDRFRVKLSRFYHDLPTHLQFGKNRNNQILPPNTSIWSRRNYFCILLDYCLCWITLYRSLLPSAKVERSLTASETEAILHTSQASIAIIQLFQNWFQSSVQSDEGFDCFFRPYLYHFMSAKHVFSANISQYGRSPALVCVSRAYMILLLQLYQTTPTRRSFDESQLEKDIIQFLNLYQIETNEIAYQSTTDEALLDDPNSDGGWSIFSTALSNQYESDDIGSRSSNSSIMSDQHYAQTELDLEYF